MSRFEKLTREQVQEYGRRGQAARQRNRKNLQREMRIKQEIVDMRERGMRDREISAALHINHQKVRQILMDREVLSSRVQRFNEGLVALGPKGLDNINYWLDKKDKAVTMWLLEKIGAAGKDQINLTINQTNNQITLNNDAIDAARAVAKAMAAAARPQLPQGDIIDAIEDTLDGDRTTPAGDSGVEGKQSEHVGVHPEDDAVEVSNGGGFDGVVGVNSGGVGNREGAESKIEENSNGQLLGGPKEGYGPESLDNKQPDNVEGLARDGES